MEKILNKEEIEEIEARRDYLVVKSNELIQKSRFDLTLPEQKTVAFICSLIKPIKQEDNINGIPFQLEYDFNIRDYCKICGINYNSGKNYAEVKATLKKLSDRSMWVEFGDEEVLCRWLAKVRTNKKSGIAHIKVDEDLVPYLFDLRKRFTQYGLYNILGMKSAFSVRLYELMKSYIKQQYMVFDLEELKRLFMVEDVKSYHRFPDFRRKVLEIALREINELTDITVSYDIVKKGNKVVKIKFYIVEKEITERMIAHGKICDLLTP